MSTSYRSEIEETGEYDLEGLFVRLGYAVDQIGAKRVVLDTLEALFSGMSNVAILRAELRRLFDWLRNRGLTAIITAERGGNTLTRYGLEEYVSDCVILLDNRVQDQVTTRRLRIVKFRGSAHGTNEYPFLLDDHGITVVPLSSTGLQHRVSNELVSTGVPGLDAMLGAGWRLSRIERAGVGRRGIWQDHPQRLLRRGELRARRTLYVLLFRRGRRTAYTQRWISGRSSAAHVESGLLRFETTRPTSFGFEMHLAHMQRELDRFQPAAVIVDPVTSFRGPDSDVHALLLRMLDMLKTRGITTIFTSLTGTGERMAQGDFGLSSLMDTWISLVDIESNGERNRGLYVLKSRGMSHSNQIREYLLTREGVKLIEAYLGITGVLTGSARLAQEAQASIEAQQQREEIARRRREIASSRAVTERRITELQAEIEAQEAEAAQLAALDKQRETMRAADRAAMGASRGVRTNGEDKIPLASQIPTRRAHEHMRVIMDDQFDPHLYAERILLGLDIEVLSAA